MRKSRKARTDPYLALLEYRNLPSQGLSTSLVRRLMSKRTRAQLRIVPQLLRPVVQPKIYQTLLAKKERQVLGDNRGPRIKERLEEEIQCDSCRLEIREAKVERCFGTRSVLRGVTEEGARYRRNRRRLRRKKGGLSECET